MTGSPVTLADPRLLWLTLLAPLVAALAAWVWRRRVRAIAAWASRGLWERLFPGYRPLRLVALVALLTLAVAATALALARPRWGVKEERVERRGVDVVLVLDTSLSMAAKDVRPDRLTVAKLLTRQLVAGLAGHRLALVQTEGDGEVLAPLTLDRSVVDLFVDALAPATLPTPGTELSHGLGKAMLLFPPQQGIQRVVVVISDGEDWSDDWDRAIPIVKKSAVIVHAIGVGTREGSLLTLPGGASGYKLDSDGKPVQTRMNPEVLERLAKDTGGVYLEAGRTAPSVAPIVDAVSKLATRSLGTDVVREQQERFQWFLGVAVAALALALAASPFRRPREVTA
jgi:Ca-activated chloride channel family protein